MRLQGHVLTFKQAEGSPVELIPDRNDEFNLKRRAGTSIRFVTDAHGQVTELALSNDDGVFTAKRKPSKAP